MLMAMNIIMSSSVLSIPVPGGHMYLNDVIIVTAAVLLDPFLAVHRGSFVLSGADVCFTGRSWAAGVRHFFVCSSYNETEPG